LNVQSANKFPKEAGGDETDDDHLSVIANKLTADGIDAAHLKIKKTNQGIGQLLDEQAPIPQQRVPIPIYNQEFEPNIVLSSGAPSGVIEVLVSPQGLPESSHARISATPSAYHRMSYPVNIYYIIA